jgi:hypothetical protein
MKQIAYYVAYRLTNHHKKKTEFTEGNVFMDAEKMAKFMTSTRNQLVVWDESAFDGMSTDWQKETQKKLIKLLYTARKYGHTMIFIIPEFSKLKDVFAGKRSIGLIRVYTPDNFSRGYFKLYNKRQKKKLYYLEKRGMDSSHVKYFRGTFVKGPDLIDEVAYEKMKDEAIASLYSEKKDEKTSKLNKSQQTRIKLAENIVQHLVAIGKCSRRELAKYGGVSHQLINDIVDKGATALN